MEEHQLCCPVLCTDIKEVLLFPARNAQSIPEGKLDVTGTSRMGETRQQWQRSLSSIRAGSPALSYCQQQDPPGLSRKLGVCEVLFLLEKPAFSQGIQYLHD